MTLVSKKGGHIMLNDVAREHAEGATSYISGYRGD